MITLTLTLAMLIQALDMTIANVALPHMQGALAATQDQVAWVLTSYIVATAIATQPAGVLAARFGRKEVFVVSVAGFTASSVLCGLSSTLPQLVVFRVLQGAFGAGIAPLAQAVLLDTYPPSRYGKAMATWSMGIMVGPILGPTLGGWITENYNWRWIFFINLPLGVIATLGVIAFIPSTTRDRSRRFDFFGFTLMAIAIGALQLMLDRGQSKDWFESTEIVIEAIASAVFLYLFVVHMFTSKRPFVEPELFADRNLVVGMVMIFLTVMIVFSTLALLPTFLQNLMGYPVLTTGYLLAPRGIGTIIAMYFVGNLVGRMDARLLVLAGLVLMAESMREMSHFTLDVGTGDLVRTALLQGFGVGFITVPLSSMAFATLEGRFRTEGTSMFSLMRNLGSSIGISIMVTLVARKTQVNHATIVESLTPFRDALQSPWLPQAWDWHTTLGAAALNGEVTRQAAAISYYNDFAMMMWAALLCAPLLLLLKVPSRSTAPVELVVE